MLLKPSSISSLDRARVIILTIRKCQSWPPMLTLLPTVAARQTPHMHSSVALILPARSVRNVQFRGPGEITNLTCGMHIRIGLLRPTPHSTLLVRLTTLLLSQYCFVVFKLRSSGRIMMMNKATFPQRPSLASDCHRQTCAYLHAFRRSQRNAIS